MTDELPPQAAPAPQQPMTLTVPAEFIAIMERIARSHEAMRDAAIKLEAASKALARTGLTENEVIDLLAGRTRVRKQAVYELFATIKRGLDPYDLLAVYLADKLKVKRQDVRAVLQGLDDLYKRTQQPKGGA